VSQQYKEIVKIERSVIRPKRRAGEEKKVADYDEQSCCFDPALDSRTVLYWPINKRKKTEETKIKIKN
jgi:hypothetical protein